MNILAFNIETIPDIDGGQRIYNLQGLDDESTSKALFHLRKQKTGEDELPLYLQRIAAISVVYRVIDEDGDHEISVKSLGDKDTSEAQLLELFFNEIEQRTPTLVSWNGTAFDLPIIHYRALKNKVVAPAYWEINVDDNSYRRDRHTDLMDVLSNYKELVGAPLNDIALLLGFPGKQVMKTAEIWEEFQQGNIDTIRNYSEVSVLNSYLIYLRFQLIRGEISDEDLNNECTMLKQKLEKSEQQHLQDFAQAWE